MLLVTCCFCFSVFVIVSQYVGDMDRWFCRLLDLTHISNRREVFMSCCGVHISNNSSRRVFPSCFLLHHLTKVSYCFCANVEFSCVRAS